MSIDAHNAALTAERQRREEVEHELAAQKVIAIAAIKSHLSALAAIGKHNNTLRVGSCHYIEVDLSLLNEHDAAIWSELRDLLHLPSIGNDKSLVITEIKRLMEYERPALAKSKESK